MSFSAELTQSVSLNESLDDDKENWKSFFKYIVGENITECNLCKLKLSGNVDSNNKRHFTTKHPAKAQELGVSVKKRKAKESDGQEPAEKKPKKMSRGSYITDCVELVTVHSLPFRAMDYDAFRSLTKTHSLGTGLVLNASNIRTFVSATAKEIRDQIKKEVHNRMISLKLDIGSRFDKSVLGVNIQLYSRSEKKLVVRSLGMVELEDKHTAKFLEEEINKILRLYNINLRNVYTFTSDNGSNMLSLGKILQSRQHDLYLGDDLREMQTADESDDENESEEEGEGFEPLNFDDDGELHGTGIARELKDLFAIVKVVRCACHVLNIAVNNTLKDLDVKAEISEIREKIKLLKGIKYKRIFKQLKIPRPRLDVETRWNSLYMMFASLRSIKEKLAEVFTYFAKKDVENVELKAEQWQFIDTFCEAFLPAYEATKLLQSNQLPMSKKHEIFSPLICHFLLTILQVNFTLFGLNVCHSSTKSLRLTNLRRK